MSTTFNPYNPSDRDEYVNKVVPPLYLSKEEAIAVYNALSFVSVSMASLGSVLQEPSVYPSINGSVSTYDAVRKKLYLYFEDSVPDGFCSFS